MIKTKSLLAGGVIAAALTFAGMPAVASAQGPDLPPCVAHLASCIVPVVTVTDPCLGDPSLPTCINDAFDRAVAAVEAGRSAYNNQVQPVLDSPSCQVYEFLTHKPCPGLFPRL